MNTFNQRIASVRRLSLAALVLFAVAVGPASAAAGSIRHDFIMRGQVLEADAGNVVVCVGKRDGAEAGQVLQVVRHVRAPTAGKSRYRREDIGSVKITSVFDEHYANAQVVKGSPKVNDTVELIR